MCYMHSYVYSLQGSAEDRRSRKSFWRCKNIYPEVTEIRICKHLERLVSWPVLFHGFQEGKMHQQENEKEATRINLEALFIQKKIIKNVTCTVNAREVLIPGTLFLVCFYWRARSINVYKCVQLETQYNLWRCIYSIPTGYHKSDQVCFMHITISSELLRLLSLVMLCIYLPSTSFCTPPCIRVEPKIGLNVVSPEVTTSMLLLL